MKCKLQVVIVMMLAMFMASPVTAATLLVNGGFEDTTGWGATGTAEFPASWGTVPSGGVNGARQQADGQAIGGITSAYMPKNPGAGMEYIGQSLSAPTSPEWQFDMDFASEDPGADRSVHMHLYYTSPFGKLIHMRVTDSDANDVGDVQVFNGAGWQTLTGLLNSVTFCSDVQSSPLVNHLQVIGHFDSASPTYDIAVRDSNGVDKLHEGIAFWGTGAATGAPVQGSGLTQLCFLNSASTADYLLDNVSLTNSVPEPSSIVMVAMGLFGLMVYAWRKRK